MDKSFEAQGYLYQGRLLLLAAIKDFYDPESTMRTACEASLRAIGSLETALALSALSDADKHNAQQQRAKALAVRARVHLVFNEVLFAKTKLNEAHELLANQNDPTWHIYVLHLMTSTNAPSTQEFAARRRYTLRTAWGYGFPYWLQAATTKVGDLQGYVSLKPPPP